MAIIKYDRDAKMRAAIAFQVTGSRKKAGESTGIPRETLGRWIANDAVFAECMTIAENKGRIILEARLGSLIDKSLKVLDEKLKSPEKISARDSATIAAILIDKLALSKNNQKTVQATNSIKQLEELARAFQSMTQGKTGTPPAKIIDAEIVGKTKPAD